MNKRREANRIQGEVFFRHNLEGGNVPNIYNGGPNDKGGHFFGVSFRPNHNRLAMALDVILEQPIAVI